jgi:PPOX class probable F420-dependent enzyme
MTLDDKLRTLLDSPRVFAMLGTVAKSGYAQVNPMWIGREGDVITFNSEIGRAKVRQLEADPRVTITLFDPEQPYAYTQLQGTVTTVTGQEAEDHIDRLAKKYLGKDSYPWRQEGAHRIKYLFTPVRSSGM